MASYIDTARLKKETNEIAAALSSPGFVAAMKKLKETPNAQRLSLAKEILSPSALAAAGVKLPAKMRVTSRYFERGSPDIIEITDKGGKLTQLATVPKGVTGWWGCGCGGAASACGGLGGGS